jgi:hypothetical protein
MGSYAYKLDIHEKNEAFKWEALPIELRIDMTEHCAFERSYSPTLPVALFIEKEKLLALFCKHKERFEDDGYYETCLERIEELFPDDEYIALYYR